MSRVKLIMLSLLAVLALGAVASSTALATHEWKYGGTTVATGSKVEIVGQQMVIGQLESEVAKLPIHVTCQMVQSPLGLESVLESGGKGKANSEYKGCTVYTVNKAGEPENQPKCETTITNSETTGEIIGSGEVKLTGATASLINKVKIAEVAGAGACSLVGTFEVTGSQVCDIPSYQYESPVGLLICTGSGSGELQMNKTPAKIYGGGAVAGVGGKNLGQS